MRVGEVWELMLAYSGLNQKKNSALEELNI
jgi:hypothetical protein